jgi:hypothetical protein
MDVERLGNGSGVVGSHPNIGFYRRKSSVHSDPARAVGVRGYCFFQVVEG